ncbi:Peptide deformylase [Methanocorpusculaceae archaeon Cs1]|uniref:Peptide deformylase n=2 Tax=Methanorbis rubei TaxID=3028300 RepID=A0AAE4MGI5_9EURY|nr:Peptide deformylase [Methanocorpusculaceae archaeon Cs1]
MISAVQYIPYMRVYIYGETVLSAGCTPVDAITPELLLQLEEMVPFMRNSRGVGLAAPQVGVPQRFFVMDAGDKLRKVINPEILSSGNSTSEMEEGCLSIPGVHKKVRRPKRIMVRYQNETGETVEEELKDFPARVFQHEYDHLDGVLFVDRLTPIARKMVARDLERLAGEKTE